jgi:hypothetical protein
MLQSIFYDTVFFCIYARVFSTERAVTPAFPSPPSGFLGLVTVCFLHALLAFHVFVVTVKTCSISFFGGCAPLHAARATMEEMEEAEAPASSSDGGGGDAAAERWRRGVSATVSDADHYNNSAAGKLAETRRAAKSRLDSLNNGTTFSAAFGRRKLAPLSTKDGNGGGGGDDDAAARGGDGRRSKGPRRKESHDDDDSPALLGAPGFAGGGGAAAARERAGAVEGLPGGGTTPTATIQTRAPSLLKKSGSNVNASPEAGAVKTKIETDREDFDRIRSDVRVEHVEGNGWRVTSAFSQDFTIEPHLDFKNSQFLRTAVYEAMPPTLGYFVCVLTEMLVFRHTLYEVGLVYVFHAALTLVHALFILYTLNAVDPSRLKAPGFNP